MSYILDALRRADAERERGAVPRLHSPNLAAPTAAGARGTSTGQREPRPVARLAVPVLVGFLAVAALALAAGWWLGRGSPTDATVTSSAGAPGAPPDARAAPSAAAGPAAAEAPGAVEPGYDGSRPVALPAPTVVVVPMPAPAPASAPASAPRTERAASAAASQSASAPAASTATTPTAEPPPLPVASLSAEQRRLWPTLTPGGSVYSDDASQRFVILNGQVLREGDSAAPGVTVEAIGPRAVLLRWGGLRVELPL